MSVEQFYHHVKVVKLLLMPQVWFYCVFMGPAFLWGLYLYILFFFIICSQKSYSGGNIGSYYMRYSFGIISEKKRKTLLKSTFVITAWF